MTEMTRTCSKASGRKPGLALAAVVLVLVLAVAAGAHLLAASNPPRAAFDTTFTTTPIGFDARGTMTALFHVEGSGFVTHVGPCTVVIDQSGVLDATRHGALAGTMTITAADGSMLIGSLAGLTGPLDDTTVEFDGVVLFLDGTGQFAGSLGKARFRGSASLVTATGEFSISPAD